MFQNPQVTFKGNPGHGSRFIEDTAVEKVRKLLNLAMDYRAAQKKRYFIQCHAYDQYEP